MSAKTWIISTSTFNLYLSVLSKEPISSGLNTRKGAVQRTEGNIFVLKSDFQSPDITADYRLSISCHKQLWGRISGGIWLWGGGFYSGRNTIVMLRLKRFKDSKRSRSFWSRTRSWQRHILNITHYIKVLTRIKKLIYIWWSEQCVMRILNVLSPFNKKPNNGYYSRLSF